MKPSVQIEKTPAKWQPRFLCQSLKSPIIISDGRVTTCTLDHEARNELANIHEHSFDEVMKRYEDTRLLAMANPLSKPMCNLCYMKLPRWHANSVPRAGWMKSEFHEDEIDAFISSFDTSKITMNLELSSKCNLACGGCSVALPHFKDTRRTANIDMDRLKEWIEPGLDRVAQLRLYHMGETWLHPRWAEFAHFVKETRPEISLFTSTNGMPLNTGEKLDRVIASRIDHVAFSIHGATQKSVERYMGRQFSLERALKAARGLVERRQQTPGSHLYISWKYLIFSWNDSDEEIAKAKTIADEVGFDEINFTITSQPSPSKRFKLHSPSWQALRDECASLWPRAKNYQSGVPMSAMYPGRKHRHYFSKKIVNTFIPNIANTDKENSVKNALETLVSMGQLDDA